MNLLAKNETNILNFRQVSDGEHMSIGDVRTTQMRLLLSVRIV